MKNMIHFRFDCSASFQLLYTVVFGELYPSIRKYVSKNYLHLLCEKYGRLLKWLNIDSNAAWYSEHEIMYIHVCGVAVICNKCASAEDIGTVEIMYNVDVFCMQWVSTEHVNTVQFCTVYIFCVCSEGQENIAVKLSLFIFYLYCVCGGCQNNIAVQ